MGFSFAHLRRKTMLLMEIATIMMETTQSATEMKEEIGNAAPSTQGVWATIGVITTALLTYLGTRFVGKKDLSEKRSVSLMTEIERLRGSFWENMTDLKGRVMDLETDLRIERDYVDALKDHIYLQLPPPPPARLKPDQIERKGRRRAA